VRNSIVRAGIVAALVALAGTAQAAPRTGAIVREPEAMRANPTSRPADNAAPTWMTDALLGAFPLAAGTARSASVPAENSSAPSAERILSAKPHQNPAFPAAFVFQSNSALFLAVATEPSPARDVPAGS
jgi:hypothetical protein